VNRRATNKTTNAACYEMYLAPRGSAITWWNCLRISGKDMAVWASVNAEFLKDYDYSITSESAVKLLTLKQRMGEVVVDFYAPTAIAIDNLSCGLSNIGYKDVIAQKKLTIIHFHRNLFIGGFYCHIFLPLYQILILVQCPLSSLDNLFWE